MLKGRYYVSNEDSRRGEALADLRKCLEYSEQLGNLHVINGADVDHEIGALYELSLKQQDPQVLVFQNIKGFPPGHRVAVNIRSSKILSNGVGLEVVQSYRKHRRKSAEPLPPVFVNTGPVMENSQTGDAVDVLSFPAPKWHKDDGGRYIGTECLVITKDPDSDWVNVGTYRVMVHDKKTMAVFIEPGKHGDVIRRKWWEKGKACPMVISVGQAPVLGAAAAATPGPGVSEFAVAGGTIGKPISLIQGPITGIPFPADAELVFEGTMPPPEEFAIPEGPFGEWPGYYASGHRPEPALKVEAVYHRNNPIIVGAPPVKPTYPATYFGTAGSALFRAAALWDELEAAGIAGVKGVYKLPGGGARFIHVISLQQLHPGHAKMAGLVAVGAGSNAYLGRIVIIVDDDIDITNPAEVMWAVSTRWDPKTQTDIFDGCWTGYIDPLLSAEKRESGDITNSRIVIYAVRPYHTKDQFPKVNIVDPNYAEEIKRKWGKELPFLSL